MMLCVSVSRRWGGGGEGGVKVYEYFFFVNNSDNLKW